MFFVSKSKILGLLDKTIWMEFFFGGEGEGEGRGRGGGGEGEGRTDTVYDGIFWGLGDVKPEWLVSFNIKIVTVYDAFLFKWLLIIMQTLFSILRS